MSKVAGFLSFQHKHVNLKIKKQQQQKNKTFLLKIKTKGLSLSYRQISCETKNRQFKIAVGIQIGGMVGGDKQQLTDFFLLINVMVHKLIKFE